MILSPYALGRTALFASQVDQRFSYCLYSPRSFQEEGENTYPLAVIVHGSLRDAQAYRDRFYWVWGMSTRAWWARWRRFSGR